MTQFIGIVGTRTANAWSLDYCKHLTRRLIDDDPFATIVTGGDDDSKMGGDIDRCAARTAKAAAAEYRLNGVESPDPLIFNPDVFPEGHPQAGKWKHRGVGLDRNTKIVDASDRVYAFWNGISTGTLDSITKASNKGSLHAIIFDNGIEWTPDCEWNPVVYGKRMPIQFDKLRIAEALRVRLHDNRESRINRLSGVAGQPVDPERLDYADGRTIHAFNSLVDGVRATRGFGDNEGYWLVPRENKKKVGVRPHMIGEDGWCNCDAVTQGRKVDNLGHGHPCFAMYVVSMYKMLVDWRPLLYCL